MVVFYLQIVAAEGGKFRIIGGEHRWQGARTLGWRVIPCVILTGDAFMDEDLQRFLSVRLNVIRGETSPEKFTKLYERMVQKYGAEQLKALFGFTSSDAWKKLTGGVVSALKATGAVSPEFLGELEKKSKNVKTVDGLGKILKDLFRQYGQDLQHSFMVFVYGGKSHLYVRMDEELFEIVFRMISSCRKTGKDINSVFKQLLK